MAGAPAVLGFGPGPEPRRHRPAVTILGSFAGARGRIAGSSTPARHVTSMVGRGSSAEIPSGAAAATPLPVTIRDTVASARTPDYRCRRGRCGRPRARPGGTIDASTARHRPCSASGQARRYHPEPRRQRPAVTIRDAAAGAGERTIDAGAALHRPCSPSG